MWFNNINISSWLPSIQSHRGFWIEGLAENSIRALQKAFELGYEIAELDVRLTADHVAILFHDEYLENQKIKDLTYKQVVSFRAVDRLDSLLNWLDTVDNFKLNLELKSEEIFDFYLERIVCGLVEKYKLESRILISSFNPITLTKVKYFSPKIKRALLLTMETRAKNNLLIRTGVLTLFCRPHVLHLRWEDYSGYYRKLSKKIPIVLWTVNDIDFYLKYKTEVHGVISDKITPAMLKNI